MASEKDDLLLRQLVMEILLEVRKGEEYLNVVLKGVLDKYNYLDGKKKAFIKKLATGCLERQTELDYVINLFSKTKTNKMKPVIRIIMEMAVYQILYMDNVYDTTACNMAVSLAKKKGFQGLSGFVNGVLRTICREKEQITYPDKEKDFIQYALVRFSMPEWIVTLWLEQYGRETTERMLEASLQENAVTVRVNENLASAVLEDLIGQWKKDGVKVSVHPYLPYAYDLAGGYGIQNLYGYDKGYFTVQDVSSMLVAECAGVKKDATVIDVCAAPGGKTMHVATKLNGSGKVISCDVSEYKTDKINENIERLRLKNVQVQVADATVENADFIEKADVVLADVPCSGLGVLGKKVDIKYRLTKEQTEEIVSLQRQIVRNVCNYVKKGGTFIYSTCTVNKAENNDNVKWMTENLPLEIVTIGNELPKELRTSVGEDGTLQLFQGVHKCDGFYIAKLRKI